MSKWAAVGALAAILLASLDAVGRFVTVFTFGAIPPELWQPVVSPAIVGFMFTLMAWTRRWNPFDKESSRMHRGVRWVPGVLAVMCFGVSVFGIAWGAHARLIGRAVLEVTPAASSSSACIQEDPSASPLIVTVRFPGEPQPFVLRACPRIPGDRVLGFFESSVGAELGAATSNTDCQRITTEDPEAELHTVVCLGKGVPDGPHSIDIRLTSAGKEIRMVKREDLRWYERFGLWLLQ
jgi:hypothetical protein